MVTGGEARVRDVIVIGGGICGIVFCKYALENRLDVLVLEKENEIGGLWRKLPSWQDLQTRKEDWSLNDLPIDGVTQSDVFKNIQAWVDRYALNPVIRLGHAVSEVKRLEPHWEVQTNRGSFLARNLLVASGIQNVPNLPVIERINPAVKEYHSSQLKNPEELRNKAVTVVGGGASAFDLLDLALEYEASSISWIYRSTKWMMPSLQPKTAKAMLRFMAFQQMWQTEASIEGALRTLLDAKYKYFGIEAIKPESPYEYRQQQLVPGRPLLIRHFNQIERYKGEIDKIEGNSISVGNSTLKTDCVLYGTGYKVDLTYLGLPEFENITRTEELSKRCGTIARSLDYEGLFFSRSKPQRSNQH